jgi:hypothetical protein
MTELLLDLDEELTRLVPAVTAGPGADLDKHTGPGDDDDGGGKDDDGGERDDGGKPDDDGGVDDDGGGKPDDDGGYESAKPGGDVD